MLCWTAAAGTTMEFCALLEDEVDVHELVGEELLVRVGEDGLQLVGTGGDVDLVVGGGQLAALQLRRVGTVKGDGIQLVVVRAAWSSTRCS